MKALLGMEQSHVTVTLGPLLALASVMLAFEDTDRLCFHMVGAEFFLVGEMDVIIKEY